MNAHNRPFNQRRLPVLVAIAALSMASSAMAQQVKDEYLDFEGGPLWLNDGPGGVPYASTGSASLLSYTPTRLSGSTASVGLNFNGVSQADMRNLLGGSYIPPDTMGAVGASQFMETTNGVYGIYSKSTGSLQSMLRADTFWANAGATGGLSGDARVMYDASSNRWIVAQFGLSFSDIQIAVSNTSDATGGWSSTKFTGYAGGTADYPTLAIDSSAVYIGTNNYNASGSFRGTTLNVIPRADLLGAGAPTTDHLKQFVTPYSPTTGGDDRGFAIQGVNGTGADSGHVIAASLFTNDTLRYDVSNPGTAGATTGPVTFLGTADYGSNQLGRQPDGTQNIDTLDQRIGASAWEMNGKIYSVYTATAVGGDHTEVRWLVTDAASNAIIQEGAIADPNYDFFEGSLSINASGQVVIGYNRSGYQTTDLNGDGLADGNVSFMARAFNSDASGMLVQTNELMLHVSGISDYHNGSVQGQPASGRQRWGDYSAVTLDPNDPQSFWAIGEYALDWNSDAYGHPGGTGGSNWGTWISQISLAPVPEPGTYAMMLAGLIAMGGFARRKSATRAG